MTRTTQAVLALLLCVTVLAPGASAAGRTQDVTWHGTQIHLYDAEAAGRYGAGVTVAVLDGWVDRSHPDFEGRVLAGADCTSGTCAPGEGRDGCTHGTHVAGTVASSSFGVARRATVLPVRVLTDDGKGGCTGTPDEVAAGIRWAVAHGARVLNLSLGPDVPGLGSSGPIPTAVQQAADAGAVVVFSAGNADLPLAQAYGANALVVAATGPSGALADYSQHGAGVSVAAPGGQPDSADHCTQAACVTSLYPGGQYAVAAGTSMAAPHVSGLAALLLGQSPGRTRQQVVDRITATARPLAGAGAGLIDVRAALGVKAAVATRPPTTAAPRPSAPAVSSRTVPTRTTAPAPRATTRPRRPSPLPTRAPVATRPPAAMPAPTVEVAPQSLPAPARDEVPAGLTAVAVVLLGAAGGAVLTAVRRP